MAHQSINKRDGGMDRYLSRTDVWAIAFGCIIGWGAFVMPGTTFLPVAGPAGTAIAMLISVGIMFVIGLNYAFLMIRHPGTGGVYTYTKEAFGRNHAFLCSWFLSLSYISIVFLNATALFVVSRTLFGSSLQFGFHYQIAGYDSYLGEVALSIAALMLIGALFVMKKPLLQRLQTVLAIVLLLGAVIITLVCLPQLRSVRPESLFGLGSGGTIPVIMTIVLLSPWAFVGFDVISLETAHFRFPVERSRSIIILAILLGGFVYIAMSLVSITAVPDGYSSWAQYIMNLESRSGVENVPTFFAAQEIMGTPGLIVMAVTALAAILTGVIGAYRATTRVLSTMAEDRILSEKFLSTRFCILFIMAISIAVSFLGRNALEWFVELTTFGAIVGFGYTSASAWRVASAEGNRAVQASGILGTLITAAFAVVQLIPKLTVFETMGAESFLMLALWCLLGFFFYWRTMQQGNLAEYNGASISSTVLFSLLLYSCVMWFLLRQIEHSQSAADRAGLYLDGTVLLLLITVGLIVMLYIQNLLRRKHEQLERDMIRTEESSLAKTRFLFNMSHDIRTPMNAIIGYTKLALKEEHSPVVGDYLGKIENASEHLLDLINDILEMSRIESGTIELEEVPCDLCALMDELRNIFANQMAEKEINFTVEAQDLKHRFVLCDQRNLNRILFNLTSNAYKFTPEGGSVALTLREIHAPEAQGTQSAHFELRVRDSGIGMSEAFTEKMFHAFERERTSTVSGIQGTGLGLAITKNLVDLMGGTIDVVTAPGQGTEFSLVFPFALAEAAAEQDCVSEEAPDFPLTGLKLLLVEDNAVNREIAQLLLTEAGFMVDSAENGLIALETVKASEPDTYAAVLMDIQMPVMDGYEAARAIRALEDTRKNRIPIVAMTANAFKEDEMAAVSAGMQGHIAKPLDLDTMLKTLRRVLRDAHCQKEGSVHA